MTDVWKNMDFPSLSKLDFRKKIGRHLSGRDVFYPDENPSPPPSEFKKNLQNSDSLLDSLNEYGIEVEII
jgi:hypothetical protein